MALWRENIDKLAEQTETARAVQQNDIKTLNSINCQFPGRKCNTNRPVDERYGNIVNQTLDQLLRLNNGQLNGYTGL